MRSKGPLVLHLATWQSIVCLFALEGMTRGLIIRSREQIAHRVARRTGAAHQADALT